MIAAPLVFALALSAAPEDGDVLTRAPGRDVKAARLVFTEALLGWCGRQVLNHPFVDTPLDPTNADWRVSEGVRPPAKPKKGQPAPAAPLSRTHIATGVSVELSADHSHCFVQIDAAGSDTLAAALRVFATHAPIGGVAAQDIRSADGHGTAYAVHGGKDGPLGVLSINDYADRPRVVTGALAREGATAKP